MPVNFLGDLSQRGAGQRMRRLESQRISSIPTCVKPVKSSVSVVSRSALSDSQRLVSLDAQLPLRMSETIGDGLFGILQDVYAVHRLQ